MRAGAQKVDRQCAGKVLLFGVLCLGLSVLPAPARAQSYEIDTVKPFGLLDVDGHVRVGHYFDERDQSSVSSGSAESQTSWEQEIYLRTRSFIYHPGFLNMVIGGGPVFVQQDFESVDEDRGIRDTLFNFESRLNFLDIKNYPFSLYFEQSHPSVTRGLAGRFIVQNRRHGFNAAIRELFSKSTGVNVSLLSSTAKGSGFGYSVDDETEQASFAMQTSYGKGGRISFNYDRTDLDSASGSPGLPIHESTQQNDLSELRLENRFGRDDQIDLFQSLSRQQRELTNAVTSTLDNRRYLARLNWRYNEITRSQFRYRYADLRQSGNNSRLHSASASLSRRLSEKATIRRVAAGSSARARSARICATFEKAVLRLRIGLIQRFSARFH